MGGVAAFAVAFAVAVSAADVAESAAAFADAIAAAPARMRQTEIYRMPPEPHQQNRIVVVFVVVA